MLHLTTYFDKNYLPRGLVLYDSLRKYCKEFELYVLCLDDDAREYFVKNATHYSEVRTVSLEEIENDDAEFRNSKGNRSKIEYYFTISPCLPLYLLKKYQLNHICLLDADICFYGSPQPLFNYLSQYSIVITPHKFSPELRKWERYGVYNVSFQIFKNDEHGVGCLKKWRSQCIEWCGDQYDEVNNRYADQKYLDEWPTLYPGKVKVLDDNVSGLAPWNLNNFALDKRHGKIFSNGEQLIFFHFHRFKIIDKDWALNGFAEYNVKTYSALDSVYLNYWNSIDAKNREVGMKKDTYERFVASGSVLSHLQRDTDVYFRLLRMKLYHVSYFTLNPFWQKLIHKFYGTR